MTAFGGSVFSFNDAIMDDGFVALNVKQNGAIQFLWNVPLLACGNEWHNLEDESC